MPTTPPAAPAVVTVPDRSDRTNFPTQMYNMFTYLVGSFWTWLQALATNVYNNAVEADADATTATTKASNASASAVLAAASAAAAAATATAVKWVSGTTYAIGNCTWSPANFQTYRRKTTGAGTTDPSADSTNWARIPDAAPTLSVVTGTSVTAVGGYHYVLTNVALTTVTLPASPAAGDLLWITVANNLFTNVIARNGKSINGLAENMTINAAYASISLRYIDSTRQWRVL